MTFILRLSPTDRKIKKLDTSNLEELENLISWMRRYTLKPVLKQLDVLPQMWLEFFQEFIVCILLFTEERRTLMSTMQTYFTAVICAKVFFWISFEVSEFDHWSHLKPLSCLPETNHWLLKQHLRSVLLLQFIVCSVVFWLSEVNC